MSLCPCGSTLLYGNCCAPFIEGKTFPRTPEALMRSRYTAFTQCNIDYIEKTMKGPAATGFDKKETETWAKQVNWQYLEIIHSHTKELNGWVEFIAHFIYRNTADSLHEISQFKYQDGQWYYIDGKQINKQDKKIGRNEACPCGSQKKFKKCCGV